MSIAAWLFFLIFITAATAKQDLLAPVQYAVDDVCMKGYLMDKAGDLGCFNMSSPWVTRLHPQPAPIPPNLMNVQVYFHSRQNISRRHNVKVFPKIKLMDADFNPSRMTFFITHGFQNTGHDAWLIKMAEAILNASDANVFIGDWGGGAMVLSYVQGTGNTRLAARLFSNLFQFLVDQRGMNITRFHCIGHSLGAQICGLIGKSIPGVFQITGLDPAQPLYSVAHESVRLQKGDAAFVMGVHSDARIFLPQVGFGYMDEVGHIDFYINSGYSQPNCQYPKILDVQHFTNIFDFFKPMYQIFLQVLLCPHQSAVEVFTEAIQARTCIFWGHAVSMSNALRGVFNSNLLGFFSQYEAADDVKCGTLTCSPLGLNTYYWPARGTFILITRGNPPFCIYEKSIIDPKEQRDLVVSVQKWFISHADKKNEKARKPVEAEEMDEADKSRRSVALTTKDDRKIGQNALWSKILSIVRKTPTNNNTGDGYISGKED